MAQNFKHTRARIKTLAHEFLGVDIVYLENHTDNDCSDLALLVRIVEELCEKVEQLDGHTHTIE